MLERLARRKPLVLVFDDIHWGEATFLDLIDHIADWTQDAPILLIAMARPELLEKRPTWGGGKRWSTTVQLEPLSDTESDELVGARHQLPEKIRRSPPLWRRQMGSDRAMRLRTSGLWRCSLVIASKSRGSR